MNINDYQKQALATETTPVFINPEVYGGDRERALMMSRVMHGMMGVVTEIGEAMDVLKKHFIYGTPIDWVNVMEEAGDKAWYIALILHAAGYTFSDALERNIAKLKKRFGGAFSQEAAVKRDLTAEREVLEGPRCRFCSHAVREDLRDEGPRGYACCSPYDCNERQAVALGIITEDGAIRMALCEIDHLILKPGVRYVFEKREGCARCEAYSTGDSTARRTAEELLAATNFDERKGVIPYSPEISELGRRLAKMVLGVA